MVRKLRTHTGFKLKALCILLAIKLCETGVAFKPGSACTVVTLTSSLSLTAGEPEL